MRSVRAALQRWIGGFTRQRTEADEGRWIVIDTETSGLDPDRDRLLAVGAVAVDRDGILVNDSFEVVLQSEAAGSAENIALHGIGHGAQAAGTPARDALAAFQAWAAGAPSAGFHTDFDRAALRGACAGAGLAFDDAPWLDLAALAAALVPEAHRYGSRSLDDWLAAFGVECTLRHNAAADALATAELLLQLRALAARQGARGFTGLLRLARQHRWLGSTH